MTKTELLLTILAEECAETAHRASKAIRFTPEEIQDGQNLTNAERIKYEFNDIVAVMEILQEQEFFTSIVDRFAIERKKDKLRQYMEYSESLGVVI